MLLNLCTRVECIHRDGLQGWTISLGDKGILLLPPSTSDVARRWSSGNGFFSASNKISLGLVEVSQNSTLIL